MFTQKGGGSIKRYQARNRYQYPAHRYRIPSTRYRPALLASSKWLILEYVGYAGVSVTIYIYMKC